MLFALLALLSTLALALPLSEESSIETSSVFNKGPTAVTTALATPTPFVTNTSGIVPTHELARYGCMDKIAEKGLLSFNEECQCFNNGYKPDRRWLIDTIDVSEVK